MPREARLVQPEKCSSQRSFQDPRFLKTKHRKAIKTTSNETFLESLARVGATHRRIEGTARDWAEVVLVRRCTWQETVGPMGRRVGGVGIGPIGLPRRWGRSCTATPELAAIFRERQYNCHPDEHSILRK